MNKTIISLKDISKDDLALAGGKGANLGEMLKANFPVPNGFGLTSFGFEKGLVVHSLS